MATLPVLLDGFGIEDEHMIMAEALFTFLVMVALLAILWRYRVPWLIALIAGLLVGYAVDVRSEGLPLLVLFPAFLAYRAARQGWKNWRGWLAAVCSPWAARRPCWPTRRGFTPGTASTR